MNEASATPLSLSTPKRADRLFLLLAGIFLGALVMTNAVAGKFFVLFGQELSCGIIAYPITFLATDLLSEIYGKRWATLVVKVGFVVSLFVTALVFLAGAAPIWEKSFVSQEAFDSVFGLMPWIVLGSMSAYLAAQLVDVHVFHWLKRLTRGKHLWLRNNGSTVFSQWVDTVVVVTVVLVVGPSLDNSEETTPLGFEDWRAIVFGQYLFKAAIALIDTPLFYVGTRYLRNWLANDPLAKSA